MSESLHLVCPHCDSVNRVPAQRLADSPRCGKCHKALFEGHPVALSTGSLTRHVESSGIPLLVDFWAPWCGPCKMMAPQFEEAARQLEPRVRLAKVNTEEEPAIGRKYNISAIPTLVLFSGGAEVGRRSGALATREIVSWAQNLLGK